MFRHSAESTAHHEAGHAAICFYLGLLERQSKAVCICITQDRAFLKPNIMHLPMQGREEQVLMLMGGPLAQWHHDFEHMAFPARPICYANQYNDPNSDMYRVREILRPVYGSRNYKKQEYLLQKDVWAIITEPHMWKAIEGVAGRVLKDGVVTEAEAFSMFNRKKAPYWFDSNHETLWKPRKPGERILD